VNKVALEQVFPKTSVSPANSYSHQGVGTIGSVVSGFASGRVQVAYADSSLTRFLSGLRAMKFGNEFLKTQSVPLT
jgi:hypothetical protein